MMKGGAKAMKLFYILVGVIIIVGLVHLYLSYKTVESFQSKKKTPLQKAQEALASAEKALKAADSNFERASEAVANAAKKVNEAKPGNAKKKAQSDLANKHKAALTANNNYNKAMKARNSAQEKVDSLASQDGAPQAPQGGTSGGSQGSNKPEIPQGGSQGSNIPQGGSQGSNKPEIPQGTGGSQGSLLTSIGSALFGESTGTNTSSGSTSSIPSMGPPPNFNTADPAAVQSQVNTYLSKLGNDGFYFQKAVPVGEAPCEMTDTSERCITYWNGVLERQFQRFAGNITNYDNAIKAFDLAASKAVTEADKQKVASERDQWMQAMSSQMKTAKSYFCSPINTAGTIRYTQFADRLPINPCA